MFSRSLAVLPLAKKALLSNTPAASVLAARFAHGPPANYKYPTMDELPVPMGCWKEDYENKQRKYNIHLLFGTGFFIVTVLFGYFSGNFKVYGVPDKPAPRGS